MCLSELFFSRPGKKFKNPDFSLEVLEAVVEGLNTRSVAAGPGRHVRELRHQPPGGGARPQERVEESSRPQSSLGRWGTIRLGPGSRDNREPGAGHQPRPPRHRGGPGVRREYCRGGQGAASPGQAQLYPFCWDSTLPFTLSLIFVA